MSVLFSLVMFFKCLTIHNCFSKINLLTVCSFHIFGTTTTQPLFQTTSRLYLFGLSVTCIVLVRLDIILVQSIVYLCRSNSVVGELFRKQQVDSPILSFGSHE